MEAVECQHCKSVMGVVRKTPRWTLYRCFSCRHIMGRINGELKGADYENAESEMDRFAGSLIGDDFRRMSPEDLAKLFGRRGKTS
jgi:hypothetical protein